MRYAQLWVLFLFRTLLIKSITKKSRVHNPAHYRLSYYYYYIVNIWAFFISPLIASAQTYSICTWNYVHAIHTHMNLVALFPYFKVLYKLLKYWHFHMHTCVIMRYFTFGTYIMNWLSVHRRHYRTNILNWSTKIILHSNWVVYFIHYASGVARIRAERCVDPPPTCEEN